MSLYQAASALNANARWQEIISENLASANIPGYKKQELSFQAVQAGMMNPASATSTGAAQPVSFATASNRVNFSPGDIRRTDVNTDLAIEGPAFFEVQLPNGATAYTRDGEFKVNAQGELVTKQGYPVMGEGGIIQLDRSGSVGVTIAADGTVSQGGSPRGKIQLTAFNDNNLLTQAGSGLFLARDPNIMPLAESGSTVRQGFLEGANTSTVAEMANMISVMRAYEANQKVIQSQDERMGRAISELGTPA